MRVLFCSTVGAIFLAALLMELDTRVQAISTQVKFGKHPAPKYHKSAILKRWALQRPSSEEDTETETPAPDVDSDDAGPDVRSLSDREAAEQAQVRARNIEWTVALAKYLCCSMEDEFGVMTTLCPCVPPT